MFARLHHLQILTGNQIVSVNDASFSNLTSLSQLDLSRNQFARNCDLMCFLEYVQNNNNFVINIGSASSYTFASPESLRGVSVLRTELSHEDYVTHTELVVALSTAGAIVVSAIVFALVYRSHWYICYYLYFVRSRLRRLLPRLEAEGHYRLCLHQREWPAGREISENIVESIEASRKVIVLLSNSFAQSRWCQVELAMASNRRFSTWRNSLVLVLLETISPENQTANNTYVP